MIKGLFFCGNCFFKRLQKITCNNLQQKNEKYAKITTKNLLTLAKNTLKLQRYPLKLFNKQRILNTIFS